MVKKVIIADDHQSWREIYVDCIKNAFPHVQVDQVETGKDLVECICAKIIL